jgi:hypothetical protein
MMRFRSGLCLLICCCAGLAACTASGPQGPSTTVTTPSVGRPQPPSSVQAALSRDAFTPYAALGQSNNDGLAANESSNALANACMTAAGYSNSGNVPFGISIVQDFTNAAQNGPLAGIGTLSNDIASEVQRDAAVKNAVRTWSACMAKNGYSFPQPQAVFFQERQNMYGGRREITVGQPVSAAARQAQLTAAVTDANCTQSADLAGIYFAVQASYEQQLVNANQQALTAAVQQYRAAYAKELAKLPALLRRAKATPFGKPKRVAP